MKSPNHPAQRPTERSIAEGMEGHLRFQVTSLDAVCPMIDNRLVARDFAALPVPAWLLVEHLCRDVSPVGSA